LIGLGKVAMPFQFRTLLVMYKQEKIEKISSTILPERPARSLCVGGEFGPLQAVTL
jgi:hypothetical protein